MACADMICQWRQIPQSTLARPVSKRGGRDELPPARRVRCELRHPRTIGPVEPHGNTLSATEHGTIGALVCGDGAVIPPQTLCGDAARAGFRLHRPSDCAGSGRISRSSSFFLRMIRSVPIALSVASRRRTAAGRAGSRRSPNIHLGPAFGTRLPPRVARVCDWSKRSASLDLSSPLPPRYDVSTIRVTCLSQKH